MKKLISAILVTILTLLALASCNTNDDTKTPDTTENVKINIGVMAGPTGMGMAKLMSDAGENSDKYAFEIYSAPTNATADLASGELDMLCLPTNTAAALANKQSDYITVLAINTLGSLYLMSDAENEIKTISDLEGKTIYASVPSSTTGPIINYILKANNVNATVEFEADHDALVAKVKDGSAPIAILPEPKATAALMQNNTYAIDLNLSTEWRKVSSTPLTMGCIVVRNEFLKEHKSAVDSFLAEYKASIEYINTPANLSTSAQMIVDAGVIPKLPVSTKALTNLYGSIVYLDGDEMKAALENFYTVIELKKPESSFYYEK